MKILFLTRSFYPSVGGVEKHILEVSHELIKQGNEVYVICLSSEVKNQKVKTKYQSKHVSDNRHVDAEQPVKSRYFEYYEVDKIKVLGIKNKSNKKPNKYKIWWYLFSKLNLIRECDIVHCHDVFFWYLPFKLILPFKKVFVTFHGYETKYPPEIKAIVVRKISEIFSNGNICVGSFIKKWYGTSPDFITYGAVHKNENKVSVKDLNTKHLNFLLLGRLERDNGAHIYLEAFKKLKKLNIKFSLTVCGDGSYKRQYNKLAYVKGFTRNVSNYIARADFMFTSSYLSILESLNSAKNVFSVYDNELKKDYLTNSPFSKYISISDNSDALVNDILLALKSRFSLLKLRKDAYKWVQTQTWNKLTYMYIRLWNK